MDFCTKAADFTGNCEIAKSGYYLTTTHGVASCAIAPVTPQCATCADFTGACITCNVGFTLTDGLCVRNCFIPNQYTNYQNLCKPNPANCSKVVNLSNPIRCETCAPNFKLAGPSYPPHLCIPVCLSNQWLRLSDFSCQSCPLFCE